TGNVHVVLIGSRGFTVLTQRAVHHHRAETQLDRTLTHVRRRAVILVHTHRNVREFFNGRQNQVAQKRRTGVLTGTGRRLHNHRRVGLVGGFHDCAHLLRVFHVESWHVVAEFGGVIQHLTHADQCHV